MLLTAGGGALADIFLSYSRSDAEKALLVKDALEAMGLTVFFDASGLHGGAAWSVVLDQELRNAGAVVGVWTKQALKREWVLNECRVGKMRRVLIPLQVEFFEPLDIPAEFTGVQFIDVTKFNGDRTTGGWPNVARTLSRTLAQPSLAGSSAGSDFGAPASRNPFMVPRSVMIGGAVLLAGAVILLVGQGIASQSRRQAEADEPAVVGTDVELDTTSDEDAWSVASSFQSREAFQHYLAAFPDGLHAREARKFVFDMGIAELQTAKQLSEPAQSAEPPPDVASIPLQKDGPAISYYGPLGWSDINALLPHLEQYVGPGLQAQDTKISVSSVPFFPGYVLLDVRSATLPAPSQRFFLYSPEKVVWLNFTNSPVYSLAKSNPIRITQDNVAAYVRFFFTYVRGKHGRFIVVESTSDVPWAQNPPQEARLAIGKLIKRMTITSVAEDGTYALEIVSIFKDSLFLSDVTVKPDGLVTLGNEVLLFEEMPVVEDTFGL